MVTQVGLGVMLEVGVGSPWACPQSQLLPEVWVPEKGWWASQQEIQIQDAALTPATLPLWGEALASGAEFKGMSKKKTLIRISNVLMQYFPTSKLMQKS